MKRTLAPLLIQLIAVGFAFAQDTPQAQPQIQPTQLPPAVQLTPPTKPGMDTSRPLGVEEAVRIALVHQTAIQIARAQLEAAHARTGQAHAGELPTLGVSGGYSQDHQLSGLSSFSAGYSGNATLNQLIFDFNVTRDSVRQAKSLELAQGHALTQSQADTVLAVKQDFYTLEQDEQLVTVAEATLHDDDGQLALARARFTEGLGAPQDVVLAQTNVDNATLQLATARSTALTARVTLANELGVDPLTPITITPSEEKDFPDDLPKLMNLALAQRPEVLAAKEGLAAATYGINAARKGGVPAFSLSAGVNGAGAANLGDSSQTTFGVSVSWSLFDGGLTASRVSEARANQVTSRKQLEQVVQNVTTDVASVYIAAKTAAQQVTITAAQVKNAQESVRLAEGRYSAGIATFLEILDAQALSTQAQINHVNALTALQAQRAGLQHAIGTNPLHQ